MRENLSLSGKVAIITGAARGQGLREAEYFIARGARVMLTDIDEAAKGGLSHETAQFHRHDVASEEDWDSVLNAVIATFGTVDILVNNAGVFEPASLIETSLASFEHHVRVNMLGTFLGMRAVVPHLKERGGAIINISSIAGLRGWPGMIAYGASKWGSRGPTQCAAKEFAPHGIRVNSIHPGLIDTPMLDGHDAKALAAFAAAVPLGRMGQVSDVAEVVAFLASDAASYITGSEIIVDGGLAL